MRLSISFKKEGNEIKKCFYTRLSWHALVVLESKLLPVEYAKFTELIQIKIA